MASFRQTQVVVGDDGYRLDAGRARGGGVPILPEGAQAGEVDRLDLGEQLMALRIVEANPEGEDVTLAVLLESSAHVIGYGQHGESS